jgi:hypothetical protein
VLRCLAIAALNARKPPNIGDDDVLQWGPTHVYDTASGFSMIL